MTSHSSKWRALLASPLRFSMYIKYIPSISSSCCPWTNCNFATHHSLLKTNLEMKKLVLLSQMMLVEICASMGSQWTCSIFIFILITNHSSNCTSKKTWYSWKYHMARKNVTYVVFSNTRKANLNWCLKAAYANYISFFNYEFFQSSSVLHKTRNWVGLGRKRTSHVNVLFSRLLL